MLRNRSGLPNLLPMSVIQVTCAVIERAGKVFVAQRAEGQALAGKWEFPGGKIDHGETAEACLQREIEEELGCRVQIEATLSPAVHDYPDGRIELIPFRCTLHSGEPKALEHAAIAWLEPSVIRGIDLADADRPILEEYLNLLS